MSQRPVPRLIASRCKLPLQLESSGCQAHRSISNHHFARRVQIFAANSQDSGGQTIDIQKSLSSEPFTLATIKPCALLDGAFMDSYLKRGKLYLLSVEKHPHGQNKACVAAGILQFCVDDETYAVLGLCGKRSSLPSQSAFRRVTIDLTREDFKAGNAEYERVLSCLVKMSSFRCVATHHDDFSGATSVSRAVNFPPESCETQRVCACTCKQEFLRGMRVPELGTLREGDAFLEESVQDLWEWLGLLHSGAHSSLQWKAPEDTFPSSLRSPQELEAKQGGGHMFESHGFLTPSFPIRALSEAQKLVKSGACMWASVCVWGFDHSLVSWGLNEHAESVVGGDNHIVVLVLPGAEECMLFEAVGGFDQRSSGHMPPNKKRKQIKDKKAAE